MVSEVFVIQTDPSKIKLVRYLIDQILPEGMLTIIQGIAGVGKTFITLDFTARVSSGTAMPFGASVTQGSVLFVSCEDDIERTLTPRLHNTGVADFKNIYFYSLKKDFLDLSKDLNKLRRVADKIPNLKLIVFDPLSAYMGETRTHEDAQVRRVLGPIKEFAEQTGIAIVAIMHLGKDKGKDITQRALGSTAFVATCRQGFHIDEKDGKLYFGHFKHNVCPFIGNRVFEITATDGAAKVVWTDEVSMDSPRELFANTSYTPIDEVGDWLVELLQCGPKDAGEILKLAIQRGFSKTTLDRAKRNRKVKSTKKSIYGGWRWSLPDSKTEEVLSELEKEAEKLDF